MRRRAIQRRCSSSFRPSNPRRAAEPNMPGRPLAPADSVALPERAPVLSGTATGPALEGTVEAALVDKTQIECNLVQAHPRHAQIAQRQVLSNLILQFFE